MTGIRARKMGRPTKPIRDRGPVLLEDTSQRSREEICTCPQAVVSLSVYFGAHHCTLCHRLIDEWGTSE